MTGQAFALFGIEAPFVKFGHTNRVDGLLWRSSPQPIFGAIGSHSKGAYPMTQTNNRILDEFAKMMNNAAGAADGVKREVETLMKGQAERFMQKMDVVSREEFEAVKAMAQKAREENDALTVRIAAIEASLAGSKAGF